MHGKTVKKKNGKKPKVALSRINDSLRKIKIKFNLIRGRLDSWLSCSNVHRDYDQEVCSN